MGLKYDFEDSPIYVKGGSTPDVADYYLVFNPLVSYRAWNVWSMPGKKKLNWPFAYDWQWEELVQMVNEMEQFNGQD